ncbi:MAG: hypothetical protein LBR97_00955 [Dysgonamonadaceae bacterium]|jgi:hypothetical protein|nr:hypothetical protein [Dysgonamonadaceae bacterium]
MAKKNTPKERFLEKLSCESSLENPFFNIEHFEITYYNTYRKTLDNEDIWEDKSIYKRINGNAIAVRILVEKDTMIAENDLSFTLKIADENYIVSKTVKTKEFHNYQNELLTMSFDTGKLDEGEYHLGTGCGNYLIQVSKIRIIDTGKKPLAMREIEETPELDDFKAFLQKQINVKYYAENNETNIPINWNMAFMGNEWQTA